MSKARGVGVCRATAAAALVAALAAAAPAAAADLAVGSKNFAESRLLGELFAQLIEERSDLEVERRLGLAGTEFCFEALRRGAIDVYPEYTGTGLVTILDEAPLADAPSTLRRVRQAFLERWDLHWLAPLGFENAYEIAVRGQLARERGLRTISDLVPLAPDLRAAFGYEFLDRPDGLPGLRDAYGLRFAKVQSMQQAVKYQAAGEGEVDVLDVYTTDGRLVQHDLQVLEDDRGFFPPYEAAPLVSGPTLERLPEIGGILSLLGGVLDGETMRHANLRLQERHEPEEVVARELLASLGLVSGATATTAGETRSRRAAVPLLRLTLQHTGLSLAALALGILVAVPTGLWLERRRRIAEPVIRVIGTSQTIPSLALLGFLIPFLGVGVVPSIVALWFYSIFPILRNTYSGIRDAAPEAVEAATALGMTPGQVLRLVRLPLAVPVIMAGVRTAGVITVGTATLAAFIGGGGLGEPIISGVQLLDTRRILSGAIPAALLAILFDLGLGRLEHLLTPKGLRIHG